MLQFFFQIGGPDRGMSRDENSNKRSHGLGRGPRDGEAIGITDAVSLKIPRSSGNKACCETSWANGFTASSTSYSTAKRRANAPNRVAEPR
jgi:hypothetical protein